MLCIFESAAGQYILFCMPSYRGCHQQAVPVAEPEWSPAYKGLCLYVARVLQPAWEEPVTVPVKRGSSQQKANIPHTTLQACSRLS
jgi:hypothetical protein